MSKLRIPHPKGDGTWVEFNNMSLRQLDVLNQINTLNKQVQTVTKVSKKSR